MGGNHSASITRPHRAVIKPGGRSGAWWAFILHKLFAVSLFKKQRKLHPGGCRWKESTDAWADDLGSFVWAFGYFWAEVCMWS